MEQTRHKQGITRQITRRWRAWRAFVRNKHALLALGLVFGLGLGGPLLCVFHCDVWMPFMSQGTSAMAHHHHMMNGQAMDDAAMAVPAGGAHLATNQQGSADSSCAMALPGDGAPNSVPMPPSPVYELLMVAPIGALLLMLLSQRAYLAPPGDPPAVAYPHSCAPQFSAPSSGLAPPHSVGARSCGLLRPALPCARPETTSTTAQDGGRSLSPPLVCTFLAWLCAMTSRL